MRALVATTTVILFGLTTGSTCHEPEVVQICHLTGDSPKSFELISVHSDSALEAHLEHGDEVFGTGLDERCEGGVRFVIDGDVEPSVPALGGLDGGPARPIGVVVNPDGQRDEFVLDEVQFRPTTPADLGAFLTTYGATVVRDDSVLIMNDDGELEVVPGGANGWHLLRIDPSRSALSDLPAEARAAGLKGEFTFSSEGAARLAALRLRELDRDVELNFLREPFAILEHPDGSGGNVNFATKWWMTEDDDPATPGDQGVSVGIVRAWDYLRYSGLPPVNGIWTPARVAIADGGFDLDPLSGLGSRDFNNNNLTPPLQVDLIDYDGTAGGFDGDWHGQGAFGACCAYPRNGFGGAGSGGDLVRPILIRTETSAFGSARATLTAAYMHAAVVNHSTGGQCGRFCRAGEELRDSHEQESIQTAVVFGTIVVAAAGNGFDNNIDDENIVPCELDFVICVGAIDDQGQNVFNWGSRVDMWAPTNILTTVSPDSADDDADDVGEDEIREFGGTSAAAPFLAGVIGMMKVAEPLLFWSDAQQILWDTANESSDQSRVLRGYVDAFRAVKALRPNPPSVTFLEPEDGATLPWNTVYFVGARVDNPLGPTGPDGEILRPFDGEVVFRSDVDGELCRAERTASFLSCVPSFATLGTHLLTATATDVFGGTGRDTIELTITNQAPAVTITSPAEGATESSDQLLPLRASVMDPNETISATNVVWESSLDGVVAIGTRAATTLSPGSHVLSATATDAFGFTGSDSVSVTIVAGSGKPSAVILTPGDNTSISTGTEITLIGVASDPEDGPLDGAAVEWYSDRDGFLGNGTSLPVVLSGPGCENFFQHVITLRVTDSDGNVDTDSIVIVVGQVC